MIRTVLIATAVMTGYASPSIAGEIKPEMVVRFAGGSLVCASIDHLAEITIEEMKGETTKAAGLMVENGGDCIMVPSNQKFKVLSVQYNDPGVDIGLLEIVGVGTVRNTGAWAYSLGAEQVKQ